MAQNINSALPLKFDFTKYSLNREESYVQIQWNTTQPEASSDSKAAPNDITYQIQILTSNGTWIKQPCEEETVNDRLMTCKIMVDRLIEKLGSSLSGDEVVIRIVAKEDDKETYSASYEIELGAQKGSIQIEEQYAGRVELNLDNSYLEISWRFFRSGLSSYQIEIAGRT